MRRPLKIGGGFLLLVVGAILALPGVPGPGIPLILLGLLLLSDRFTWAARLLNWARRTVASRTPKERAASPPCGEETAPDRR